jgi:hypothetical protein
MFTSDATVRLPAIPVFSVQDAKRTREAGDWPCWSVLKTGYSVHFYANRKRTKGAQEPILKITFRNIMFFLYGDGASWHMSEIMQPVYFTILLKFLLL